MTSRIPEVTEIRKRMMKKQGISKQTLTKRITNLKQLCPIEITTEYATYLYAREIKEPLSILSKDKRDELNRILGDIRLHNSSLQTTGSIVLSEPIKKETKKTSKEKKILVNIGKYQLNVLNLPPSRLKEAEEMTELYYCLYIFENSLRYYVVEIMKTRFGSNWWNSKIKEDLRKKVKEMKQKERKKLTFKDEPHPIFYTTIAQLIGIIEQFWIEFKDIFGSLSRIKYFCEPIKSMRNPIAHNNRLSKKEKIIFVNSIQKWFEDLNKLKP